MKENNTTHSNYAQIHDQVINLLIKEDKSTHEVEEYLLNLGLTEKDAKIIIDKAIEHVIKLKKIKAGKDIQYGLLWGIGGTLATWVSYSMASKAGSIFYVTWGAIIYGFILLSKGLFNSYLVKRTTSKIPMRNINIMKIIGIILLIICFIHSVITGFNYTSENIPWILGTLIFASFCLIYRNKPTGNSVHSNEQKGKKVILSFKINILLSLLILGSIIWQYMIIQEFPNNHPIPIEILSTPEQIQNIIHVGVLLSTITCCIIFLLWFKREYHNLHAINPKLKYKEAWAIWSWFIPVINLWRPYQIMKEIYIHATTTEKKEIHPEEEEIITTPIIDLWWLLWIASNVLSQVNNRLPETTIIIDLKSAHILSILTFGILIIDAMLLIKIINKINSKTRIDESYIE